MPRRFPVRGCRIHPLDNATDFSNSAIRLSCSEDDPAYQSLIHDLLCHSPVPFHQRQHLQGLTFSDQWQAHPINVHSANCVTGTLPKGTLLRPTPFSLPCTYEPILPIEVVFPTPFTPTKSMTARFIFKVNLPIVHIFFVEIHQFFNDHADARHPFFQTGFIAELFIRFEATDACHHNQGFF